MVLAKQQNGFVLQIVIGLLMVGLKVGHIEVFLKWSWKSLFNFAWLWK